MQIQTLSFIYCKSRQLFNNNVLTFTFLVAITLYLSTDWFMDRYFMPKNIGFVVGIVLWGIICICNKKQNIELTIDFLFIAFSTFIGYIFICSLFTPYYMHSVYVLSGWILFVLMRNREKLVKIFNYVLSVAGVVSALYGLLQYGGYIETQSYFPIIGSYDNPAGFAVSIILCYPFLLCSSFEKKRKIIKILICLLLFLAVILSNSRTGILAFCIVTLLYYTNYYKRLFYRKLTFFSMGILFLTGLFIGLIFLKPNSTSGRILIWKISTGLCQNHIVGNGTGSFKTDYMTEQAKYFSSFHNDEKEKMLAGNTNHPFNEYLLLLIEYGFLGIVLLLLLFIAVFRKNVSFDNPAFLALVSIAVFACFSYPFKYAFVWFITIYCLSSINQQRIVTRKIYFKKNLLSLILLILFSLTIVNIIFEYTWKRVSLVAEKNEGLLDNELLVYDRLYKIWNGNPYFLYNYASELKNIELYQQSIDIFLICESYINTYNLQMQLADNYYQMRHWKEAEIRYKKAQYMCPNRFLPLQGLLRTYEKSNNKILAQQVAWEIVNKRIKIPSYTISAIQEEARLYLLNNKN